MKTLRQIGAGLVLAILVGAGVFFGLGVAGSAIDSGGITTPVSLANGGTASSTLTNCTTGNPLTVTSGAVACFAAINSATIGGTTAAAGTFTTGRANLLLATPTGATAPTTAAGANDGPLDLATNGTNAFAAMRTYNSLGTNTGYFAYADTAVGGSRADEIEMGALGSRALGFLPANTVLGRWTSSGLVVGTSSVAGAAPAAAIEVRTGGLTVTGGNTSLAATTTFSGSGNQITGGSSITTGKWYVYESGNVVYGFGIASNNFIHFADTTATSFTWNIYDKTTLTEKMRLSLAAIPLLGIGGTPTAQFHVLGGTPASVSSGNGTAGTAALTITEGNGGAVTTASGTVVGGAAAANVLTTGVGGAATGASTQNTGGAGGDWTYTMGNGGAASGATTNIGGRGSDWALTAGTGGNAVGGATGGRGGNISLTAGNAGTGGNAAGGTITLTAGSKTGTGAPGSVILASQNDLGLGTFTTAQETATCTNGQIHWNSTTSTSRVCLSNVWYSLYTGSSEHDFGSYNSANIAAGVAFGQTKCTNASTLTADSNLTYDIAGFGAGNFVAKLCSDGATCAGGNIYLTCTKACTDAAGTTTACTVTTAAVPAATVLTWSVTTACATTDPGVNATAHFTTP